MPKGGIDNSDYYKQMEKDLQKVSSLQDGLFSNFQKEEIAQKGISELLETKVTSLEKLVQLQSEEYKKASQANSLLSKNQTLMENIQGRAERMALLNNQDLQTRIQADKVAEKIASAKEKQLQIQQDYNAEQDANVQAEEAIVKAMEKRVEQQKKNEEFFGYFKDKWDDFIAIAQDPKIATGAFVAAWAAQGVEFAGTMKEVGGQIGMSLDQSMSMGTELAGASLQGALLGIGAKETAEAFGGLSEEFGGMANISKDMVTHTAKMAKHYNMSGADSAKLLYNAMELSDGSEATAKSSLETVENLARGASVPIGKVMTDVANSADLIAQYSYDNVEALGKAAVEAAKMGTSLSQMAQTADKLMNLDDARNNAMQLSVMLGRQINIDKAQQLIYNGDLEGGYKEMLNQLGGISQWNQMDYYQKKAAAEMMGVSVGELQKQLNLQAGLTETGEKHASGWAKVAGWASDTWDFAQKNAVTIGATVNMVGAMGKGLASFAPAIGGIGGKMKDAFKGSGIGKFLGHGKGGGGDKDVSVPDVDTPKKGVGDRLKDLAKGLREMGKNTFKGIAALALAGPAMVLAVPAIPFLTFMGLVPLQMLESNLTGLGKGLAKINNKAFLGATILGVLGISGALMVAAIPALAFIAIAGIPLQFGLQGLGKGLSSLGQAAMNPYTWLGVVLLGAIGVALIPFGVALMFAGAGMGLFAAGLAMMMAMVPPIIEAIANAIVKIIGAFAQFVMTVSELPIEKLLIMGPALALLGVGFAALGVGMMMAMPSLLLLSLLGPTVFPVLGKLFDTLAPAIKAVADAFSQILESAGAFFNILKEINPLKLIGLAYGMGLMGIAGVTLLFGTYGIAAAGVALGVMAGALSLIPENFDMPSFAAGLGMMGAVGLLLGPAAIGIGLFSLSLIGLAGALALLTPFLPSLMALATIGGGLFAVTQFAKGGGEGEGGDAIIKPTNANIIVGGKMAAAGIGEGGGGGTEAVIAKLDELIEKFVSGQGDEGNKQKQPIQLVVNLDGNKIGETLAEYEI